MSSSKKYPVWTTDGSKITSPGRIVRGDKDNERIFPEGVIVRKTPYGLGLFAARNFKKSKTLGRVHGLVLSDPDYSSHYCIDAGSPLSLEPFAPFCYLNHCCEPNARFYLLESDSRFQTANRERPLKPIPPEEREYFLNENGETCYYEDCFRKSCYGCPEYDQCESYDPDDLPSWLKKKPYPDVDLRIEAIRDIKKGDEITIDYCWPADQAIKCLCGSPHCRGWIVDLAELHLIK